MSKRNTQALLERVSNIAGSLGARTTVGKTDEVITTTNQQTGDFMNRKQVHALLVLAKRESEWLSATTIKTVSQRAGQIPTIELTDVSMEPATEGEAQTAANVPDTDRIDYSLSKFHGTSFITTEDLDEAAASGEPDFDGKVRRLIANRIGRDIALLSIAGDTSITHSGSARRNRYLRVADGWLKQIRDAGNYATTTRGSAFSADAFIACKDLLPEEYQDDPSLRFFVPPMLDSNWMASLADNGSDSGSRVAEGALTTRERVRPLGIDQLIVPQMRTDLGFDFLDGSPSNADSVSGSSAPITFVVNTLLGGAAAGNAGRKVKIKCTATGESETLTVKWNGTNNYVTSAGVFGQGSVSTTASDYTYDVADTTEVLCTSPSNLVTVIQSSQFRFYRKFEQEADRVRMDWYIYMTPLVIRPRAASIQGGIIVKRRQFGS